MNLRLRVIVCEDTKEHMPSLVWADHQGSTKRFYPVVLEELDQAATSKGFGEVWKPVEIYEDRVRDDGV